MKKNIENIFFTLIVYFLITLIVLPIFIVLLFSFSKSGFIWPPSGFTLQWYREALNYGPFLAGLRISFLLGLIASIFAISLGMMSSIAIVRHDFRGKNIFNTILMSPLMVPVALLGLTLYMFLAKLGMMGNFYSLLVGHTILLMPYSLRLITASFQTVNKSFEDAAVNLGASSIKVFFSITLPLIRTGIISGFLMSFIASWNSFAFSMFLAGPKAYPLPLQLYDYIRFEWSPVVIALSGMLIAIGLAAIIIVDRLIGITFAVGPSKMQ